MDTDLAGFVALAALVVGLFAWLRQDIRAVRGEMSELRDEMRGEIGKLRGEMLGGMDKLRGEMNELRDRVARIEGLLEGAFMRRDLAPAPEPPPGAPPGRPKAA